MIRNSIARAVSSLVTRPVNGAKLSFETVMKKLFANGEQGFFYDPNDLSTLYQDAAGKNGVNASGQPVGLVLDKSKGLAVGPELVDLSKWVARSNTAITVTGNKVRISAIADGSWGADLNYTSPTISGKRYKVLFNLVKSNLQASLYARFTTVGGATMYGEGNHSLAELSTGSTVAAIATTGGKAGDYFEVELSVVELPGNHAFQTDSASRPILRQNAVTGAYYLEFDGSDDFLVTNSIDFTATDEVSLFAGVRKLSDATTGVVCELGITSKQAFSIYAPAGNGLYKFSARNSASGNGAFTTSSLYSAPKSVVLSANIDSASSVKMRLNATIEEVSTDVNGLTMINAPVYIGRRGGTTLPFNGHIYSLIGIGRLTTASETVSIEKELARRTGVTLSV